MQSLTSCEQLIQKKYEAFTQEWYQVAEKEKKKEPVKPSIINQLCLKTENMAESLKRFATNGDLEFANTLADTILLTFDQHSYSKSKMLAKWIGRHSKENAGMEFSGPYKSLRRLFSTIENIKNCYRFSPELIDNSLPLSMLYIDSTAANHVKKFEFPPEVMKLIVTNFVQSHSIQEAISLEKTSKITRQQVAEAYQGPLTEIHVNTAQKAIKYAKKFGLNLNYIDISSIEFSKTDFLEFIQHLPNLNTLVAKDCNAKVFIEEISDSPKNFEKLISLNLQNNRIKDKSIQMIAPHLKNLESLNLAYNRIGNESANPIATLTNLTELTLSDNNFGDEGIEVIASHLKNLKSLKIACNNIQDQGAKAIASLSDLTELDLSSNFIGDEGAIALSTLTKLTILNLEDNEIGNEGTECISANLINLKCLILSNQLGG